MLCQKSRLQEINIQIPLALWVLFTISVIFRPSMSQKFGE